jgi:hypothetical protein
MLGKPVELRGQITFPFAWLVSVLSHEFRINQILQLICECGLTFTGHILKFGERNQMLRMTEDLLDSEVARLLREQVEDTSLLCEWSVSVPGIGLTHEDS